MIGLLNAVGALLFLRTEGLDLQAQLLDQRPADEATHGVGLPTRQLPDFGQRGTLGAAHPIDHFGLLAALAGDISRSLRGCARGVASLALPCVLRPLPLCRRDVSRLFRN